MKKNTLICFILIILSLFIKADFCLAKEALFSSVNFNEKNDLIYISAAPTYDTKNLSNNKNAIDNYDYIIKSVNAAKSNNRFDSKDALSGLCKKASKTLRFFGYLILIARIAIPFIVIFNVTKDLFNMVLSGKSSDAKAPFNRFLWSFIGAVFMFLAPTVINAFVQLAPAAGSDQASVINDLKICSSCLLSPYSGECE